MFQSIFQGFYSFWSGIANIGITPGLSFSEKKKTQLLNVVVATGVPLNVFFGMLNLLEHKPLLAGINLLLFLGAIAILVINSRRQYLLARLVLSFVSGLLFTVSAIFFRNGTEHYLLVNLIVVIIYFSETRFLILISVVNCLLFVGVKIILNTSFVYSTMPVARVVFNTSWALMIMVIALLYFKTEQRSYQRQVEEKNKELEKLNNTKEKLFSIIAHDLRSPIGQLKSSLELVNKEYISPETFRQISSKLSAEVDQLHSTLDNLLRWSISQFQGIKALPEKVSLADTIDKMAPLFKQSLERKNITLKTENTDHSVLIDPDHFMLVLRNLVSNAVKYSYQDGTITIRSRAEGQHVIIEVADTGMGMSDEVKDSILNSANMVTLNGTYNEKGTGLGLKLCREFIEKNNGRVWVESAEQKGSSFFVSIPQAN